MTRLEYRLAAGVLRVLAALFRLLPRDPRRVVLASHRLPWLDGNLAYIYAAMQRLRPDLRYAVLAEPYAYDFRGKVAYLLRLVRAMYHLQTARLFVVDNAYLPIHVAPHRKSTTVVQVWHGVAGIKRVGLDTTRPPDEPERTFLHRHYDNVVCSSESWRPAYARAFRTPVERVLALGAARTDFFFDEGALGAAASAVRTAHPQLAGRRLVLYAPTFRGRGPDKRAAAGLDAARLRAALPADVVLALKTHPNLDPRATSREGFDLVFEPALELNGILAATDILITDYSTSVMEWALLKRPLILFVPDLAEFEANPGLYLDYRTEMIGSLAVTTDEVAAAINRAPSVPADVDAFVALHLGACDGGASERFVRHFLGAGGPS
ncbi:MAG: CDP-glycerol glycerophosphotransferase family protein [Candidatus Limnocylindrales bacterium]